jgi:hypothetical protein
MKKKWGNKIMKKNIILVTGCFLIAVIVPLLKQSDPVLKPFHQHMLTAYQGAEIQFCESRVQGWAHINTKFSSMKELNDYANQVERVLAPIKPLKREESRDSKFNSLTMNGSVTAGLSAQVIFQSLSVGEKDQERETYLIINVIDFRGPETLGLNREKVVSVFKEFGKQAEINQMIIGFKSGLLGKEEQNKIMKNIFQAVGADTNQGVNEDNYVSRTGYVPGLGNTVTVGRNKVNMQAALAGNEIENKTYVYIGSPLVFSDY